MEVVENFSHLTNTTESRRRSSAGGHRLVLALQAKGYGLQDHVAPTAMQSAPTIIDQCDDNFPSSSQHSQSPDVSVSF